MADIGELFKKNRIKIVKGIITIVVVYFLFCSLMELFNELSRNYFRTTTILYIILVVICNLLSEFSPYVLHNYLLAVFPFLAYYNGRGIIYIIVGILYLSPELNKGMNWAGISIIIVGTICIWINWVITKSAQIEYQNVFAIKDNFLKMDEETPQLDEASSDNNKNTIPINTNTPIECIKQQ